MEGPFRGSQPPDRRVVSRSEPAPPRHVEEPPQPKPVIQEQPTVHRTPVPHISAEDKKPVKRFIWPGVAIIAVVLIVLVGFFVWSKASQNAGTGIDSSKYQAVFFTNGQVYFGKLHTFNEESMKLTNIWYLQTTAADEDSENPQETTSSQNDVKIIKLGNELHGPEDQMILLKDQVLFYENLKADSKVVKAIEDGLK